MTDAPIWSAEQLESAGRAIEHGHDRDAIGQTFGIAPDHLDAFLAQARAQHARAKGDRP